MLTVGSLFSGIGGLDLGLERAGHKVIWQSEIDSYASRVLKQHWPDVPNIGDVTKIDWGTIPYVDLIAGGYPCQPFSTAGKRGGTNDARHLWPYFRNAIGRIRPRYALLENVPGHVTLGLPTVISDLATLGYDAEWQIISAAAFGAPHLRERLFIVAYPASGASRHAQPHGLGEVFGQTTKFVKKNSDNRTHGDWWKSEPDVGRVANGVSNRVDRLKGLGNAVVPQVAEFVGYLIREHAKQFQ